MQRHEFLISLASPFFETLKRDLIARAALHQSRFRIDVEAVSTRLLFRGDQCSFDLTLLPIERETIKARYGQKRQTQSIEMRLDILDDAVVLRDPNGTVIDDPSDYVFGPFLLILKNPASLASPGFSEPVARQLARMARPAGKK